MQRNRYVIIFIDYLTKWVEDYGTEDQTSKTDAQLLVDNGCVSSWGLW